MPLPKGAEKFFELALGRIRKNGIIHFYDFAEVDKHEKILKNVERECKKHNKKLKVLRIVKCGQFSPRVSRICVDIKIL